MSIGTWSPDTGNTARLERSWLDRFIALGRDADLERLPTLLTPREQADLAPCMRVPAGDWQAIVQDYDNEALWHLIRFLTMTEMHLPGWQAGKDSPVIWVHRVLKQRGAPLSKEQLHWIRAHSDNRFIPNGAL